MDPEALRRTMDEWAGQRGPIDEAMTLLAEGVVALESAAKDGAEGRGDPAALRARLERARSLLSACKALLDGARPDARALPAYVGRALALADELLGT